ncbi:MAG: acyl-ACP--UDP-N-acetylglucosamine O-acyltransferase [Candidatus Stahlbacteria bacterium]|nr:MAG: acyl-ACP--UDP-N-acetylglucosamine O-acyltransferase [Candidatus Stahlbacteria bacterium]
MNKIHPTAVLSAGARLHEGVSVGPYAVIEEDVIIGAETRILSHAVIKPHVRIGKNCMIAEHVVLGGLPQDTRFAGERSFLVLADNVTIREFATLHRATGEGEATKVGKGSYIMAYAHVSHNCKLGGQVTLANGVQLAGHVEVGEQAFLGGSSGVHQFVRIGRLAMLGAHSYLTQDLPPFLLGSGHPFHVAGVNRVGLERAGFPLERRTLITKLYRMIYQDPRPRDKALAELLPKERLIPEVAEFLNFIDSSRRGIRLKTRVR